MPDFDWKAIVRNTAPVLGAALGGPLAGAAIKVLGDQLLGNPDATEGDVAAAVVAGLSGEQIAAMKKAELDFQLEMRRIDQETDAAILADTANARAQTVDLAKTESPLAWGAAIISTLIIVGFFTAVYLLFVVDKGWDERTANLLNVLFGALTVSFTQVANYWLGSSAGSKRAGDSVRKIAEQSAKP